jgi:lysophospholipase L1-like esterase
VDPAPLLYKPKKVLSVRSYDLKTEYTEGIDYTVENGCIALTANSRIRAWDYDDFYLCSPSAKPVGGLPCLSVPGRYFVFGDGALFGKYQVCVTYTHEDGWSGPVPSYQGHKLPATSMALAQKQALNIVYYGDSVTVGKEASGLLNIAPNMPTWVDMLNESLEQMTGASILSTRTAKGGQTAQWGLANVEENVNRYHPDLVILAFGMNDGSRKHTPSTFKANIESILRAIRNKNPNCEFLLVATHLPNPDEGTRQGPHTEYVACLNDIANSMCCVAVANVTEVHQYLLTKKRYGDMTANNVNHPNDWLISVQGQIIAQALWPNLQ